MWRTFRMLATAARRPRTKVEDGHDRTAAAAPDGIVSTSATVSDRIRCWGNKRSSARVVRRLIRRSLSLARQQ
jgi:hypothetical protein